MAEGLLLSLVYFCALNQFCDTTNFYGGHFVGITQQQSGSISVNQWNELLHCLDGGKTCLKNIHVQFLLYPGDTLQVFDRLFHIKSSKKIHFLQKNTANYHHANWNGKWLHCFQCWCISSSQHLFNIERLAGHALLALFSVCSCVKWQVGCAVSSPQIQKIFLMADSW